MNAGLRAFAFISGSSHFRLSEQVESAQKRVDKNSGHTSGH
jgi:hypothetical protein